MSVLVGYTFTSVKDTNNNVIALVVQYAPTTAAYTKAYRFGRSTTLAMEPNDDGVAADTIFTLGGVKAIITFKQSEIALLFSGAPDATTPINNFNTLSANMP